MNDDKPALGAKDFSARPSRARYDKVKSTLDLKWRRRQLQSDRMMREVVDQLWDVFGGQPWTFCGFWILQPDGTAFQPGPARPEAGKAPRPSTGPIGLALTALDSKAGATEIFVPTFDKNQRVWAVLEVRSPAPFDDMDARWLERLLKAFQTVERRVPEL